LLFLAFSSLRLTVASSLAIVGSLVTSMPASIAPESLMPSSSSDESSPSELDEWYADGSRPVSSGAACSAALSPAPAPSFLRFCERSDLGSGWGASWTRFDHGFLVSFLDDDDAAAEVDGFASDDAAAAAGAAAAALAFEALVERSAGMT
jgi:hypothetical protein